jgi:hypothetical protein
MRTLAQICHQGVTCLIHYRPYIVYGNRKINTVRNDKAIAIIKQTLRADENIKQRLHQHIAESKKGTRYHFTFFNAGLRCLLKRQLHGGSDLQELAGTCEWRSKKIKRLL